MDNPLSSEDARWSLVAAGSAVLASILVRNALKQGWRLWKDEDPPNNPADPEVTWRDALVWAGVTGAAVALGRVMARRGAAAGWRRFTGNHPPR